MVSPGGILSFATHSDALRRVGVMMMPQAHLAIALQKRTDRRGRDRGPVRAHSCADGREACSDAAGAHALTVARATGSAVVYLYVVDTWSGRCEGAANVAEAPSPHGAGGTDLGRGREFGDESRGPVPVHDRRGRYGRYHRSVCTRLRPCGDGEPWEEPLSEPQRSDARVRHERSCTVSRVRCASSARSGTTQTEAHLARSSTFADTFASVRTISGPRPNIRCPLGPVARPPR
jgi:hypothetical protein